MPIRILFPLLILLVAMPAQAARYAVALSPTPVLNTPDFPAVFGGRDRTTPAADRCGQLRAVEFVALPGTLFTVEGETAVGDARILRVTTRDYPYPTKSGYYLDSRFVRIQTDRPAERHPRLPERAEILARLRAHKGARYVWGGNIPAGVGALLAYYPPVKPLDREQRDIWQLRGVDCSGLLYQATDGATPRNTSALVAFGSGVPVAGKSPSAITRQLRPLDLIVWPGHVMIVLDGNEVIESRLDCANPSDGVRIRPLQPALEQLMTRRRPADRLFGKGEGSFLVRRWFEHH